MKHGKDNPGIFYPEVKQGNSSEYNCIMAYWHLLSFVICTCVVRGKDWWPKSMPQWA